MWFHAAVASLILVGISCGGGVPTPIPGAADWMKYQQFPVRDGAIQLAGGNLVLQYTDYSKDTILRIPFNIVRTFNSATQSWMFNFQTTFVDGIFTDPSGTRYNLANASPGPISGSIWTLMDSTHIRTRGGLVYAFNATDGTLQQIYWMTSPSIYLSFLKNTSGQITEIDACVPFQGQCVAKYTILYLPGGGIGSISSSGNSQTAGSYTWSGASLATAKSGFEVAGGLTGSAFIYTAGQGSCPSGAANCLSVTNSEGETVNYGFDSVGRTVSYEKVGGDNPTWTFMYGGGTTWVTDPLGKVTQFDFSDLSHVSKVTLPLGEVAQLTWVGDRPVTFTLPNGTTASFSWFNDDILTVTPPNREQITFAYGSQLLNFENPAVTLPTSVSDSMGTLVSRTADSYGRVTSESNGLNESTQIAYDTTNTLHCGGLCWFTLIASTTDAAGVVRVFTNDKTAGSYAQPTAVATGSFTQQFIYDPAGGMGNLRNGPDSSSTGTNMPNLLGRSFDANRLVSAVTVGDWLSGGQETIQMTRRSDGRLTEIVRPSAVDVQSINGDPTLPANSRFLYDALGQLQERDEMTDGVWAQPIQYGYDDRGAVTSVTRANGMRTEIVYDDDGRPVGILNLINGSVESRETRTFDHTTGQLTSITDSTQPNPTSFAYYPAGNAAAGRVETITWPHGEQTSFVYDARGRVTDINLTNGGALLRSIHKIYDLADRVIEVDSGNALLYKISYVNARPSSVTYGNGLVRTFTYDSATGRVTGATTKLGSQVVETLTDQQAGWILGAGSATTSAETFSADTFDYSAPATATTFGAASTEEDVKGGFYFNSVPSTFVGADAMTQQYCGGIAADGVSCAFDKPEIIHYPASYGYIYQSQVSICFSNTNGGPCVQASPTGGQWVQLTLHNFLRNAERTRLHTVQREDITVDPNGTTRSNVTSTLHTYTWDSAGFAATKDGQPLTWTATGRLADIGNNAMTYDAEGRLTSIRFSDGTTWTSRFGGLVMADASGNPLYLDLGVCRVNLVDDTTLYRHPDLRGNAGKSTSNDAGQITSVNSYTPYGVESRQGTDRSDRMTFAQGIVDGSLVFLGPRVFDEDALQFLSPDPAYGLLHQYAYAQGDPIHYFDDGLAPNFFSIPHTITGAIEQGSALTGGVTQVLAGGGICLSSGVGCVVGVPLMALGVNNVLEGLSGQDAFLRNLAKTGAVQAGFSERAGSVAFTVVDVGTSVPDFIKYVPRETVLVLAEFSGPELRLYLLEYTEFVRRYSQLTRLEIARELARELLPAGLGIYDTVTGPLDSPGSGGE
jgi:RHS repeat-associated protein